MAAQVLLGSRKYSYENVAPIGPMTMDQPTLPICFSNSDFEGAGRASKRSYKPNGGRLCTNHTYRTMRGVGRHAMPSRRDKSRSLGGPAPRSNRQHAQEKYALSLPAIAALPLPCVMIPPPAADNNSVHAHRFATEKTRRRNHQQCLSGDIHPRPHRISEIKWPSRPETTRAKAIKCRALRRLQAGGQNSILEVQTHVTRTATMALSVIGDLHGEISLKGRHTTNCKRMRPIMGLIGS